MTFTSDIRLFILAAAITIVAACDHNEPGGIAGDVEFSAVCDAFEFAEGDRIAVMNAEKPFEASVKENGVSFIGDVLQSDEYYGIYPYSALKYFAPEEPAVAVMTLPTVQKAVKNEIPRELRLSIGRASDDDRNMHFQELVSYFKFTIGPESGNIRSVSVVSRSSPLTGDCAVMCNDGYGAYPMPGSAYNVCLAAEGNTLEPGDYYIAFRYVSALTLDIAYEDDKGRIALKSMSLSSYTPGEVIDMGTVADLTFQNRSIIPKTSTYILRGPAAGVQDMEMLSSAPLEINILEGSEWLSVFDTREVSSSAYRLAFEENTGSARIGVFEVVSADDGMRLLYTVVQYGLADESYDETLHQSLMAFYDSAGGDGWRNNTNWGSDKPFYEWYGISFTEWGEFYAISMYDNDLTGTLPETFDGFRPLRQLILSKNKLSGNIPSYIYDALDVDLSYNSFESLSDVDDPEKALTSELDLAGNSLRGPLPEKVPEIPHLTCVNFANNDFSGTIPDSYGKILERNGRLSLNGNSLSGPIPASILADEGFRDGYWTNILFQEGEGFEFTDVEIYADFAICYDFNGQSFNSSECYSSNEYTLYADLYSDYETFLKISSWSGQYAGNGFGVLCYTDRNIYEDVCGTCGSGWQFVKSRCYTSNIKFLLVDSDGRVVLNPATAGLDEILSFLEGKFGTYDEPDPLDGIVTTLQTAENGYGIDIVLMGDSYGNDALNDGTYEAVMRETMDYFFEIEPYRSYRHLFNVYMVNVVSEHGSRLEVSYGEGNSITGNDDLCFRYASKALSSERMQNALLITIVNSSRFGGSTYMYAPEDGDWGNGKAVAYIPKVPMKMDFRGLIQHEAGGHGFAKLADEYVGEAGESVPEAEKELMQANEKYGWYRNVDFTGDPSKVKWAHILSDERYAAEPEGVYAGALGYGTGVWRPAYTSIMKDNQGAFNAPSREAIWYRIHRLAYGSQWQYDFEDFAEYDAINRLPIE